MARGPCGEAAARAAALPGAHQAEQHGGSDKRHAGARPVAEQHLRRVRLEIRVSGFAPDGAAHRIGWERTSPGAAHLRPLPQHQRHAVEAGHQRGAQAAAEGLSHLARARDASQPEAAGARRRAGCAARREVALQEAGLCIAPAAAAKGRRSSFGACVEQGAAETGAVAGTSHVSVSAITYTRGE